VAIKAAIPPDDVRPDVDLKDAKSILRWSKGSRTLIADYGYGELDLQLPS
jgi:hypothetical protein